MKPRDRAERLSEGLRHEVGERVANAAAADSHRTQATNPMHLRLRHALAVNRGGGR